MPLRFPARPRSVAPPVGRRAARRFVAPLFAFGLGGCGSSLDLYDYTLTPEEFAQDFGSQAGTMPTVACHADADCRAIPNLPAGATVACDTTASQCAASFPVNLFQTVNLSQQALPAAVVAAPVISVVHVGAVHYWTAANTLTVASPAISLYVGPQTAQKPGDAGVTQLGTIPPIAAQTKTACKSGTPGTEASACDVQLTAAGQDALGTLAREIKTPFNVIAGAELTVHGGEPLPAGKIDFFVEPVISFVL